MKIKIKNGDKCECFIEVAVPADTVKDAYSKVYRDIAKHAHVPGFRAGNAPQDMIEKKYGERAREEVLKELIPAAYRQAVTEKKIDPVEMPEISDVNFGPDQSLSFKAKVSVRPQIKLKKYKSLKLRHQKISVIDEEVDTAIKHLQGIHAQFNPIAEKRPVKKGDFAICDMEAFIDDKPITKKHENMWIEVNKEASLLGMGEQLVGVNIGDTKEIDAELPANYPDKKYAGKKARFRISVKELKEKKLPEIDGDFAKDLGVESIETLRNNIKDQLYARKEQNRLISLKNQIIENLLRECRPSVPASMEQRQYDVLMKRLEEELLKGGMQKDVVDAKKKEAEARVRDEAVNKIRIYFILDHIAEKEDIKINQEDVDKRFEEIAAMSKQDVKTARRYYEKNNLIDGLLEQIREEKTLDWLLKEAELEIK